MGIPLIEENGIESVTGSHNRWDTELEHNIRLVLKGHKNNEPLPNAEIIELALGDILIFSAQIIHKGNYELNPTRKAFDICVGKRYPLTSSFFDGDILPKKDETIHISNNQWYKLAQEIS
ncbi:MAG: hypothetical protein ACI9D5_002890 [Candidatus Endobugula sp.]